MIYTNDVVPICIYKVKTSQHLMIIKTKLTGLKCMKLFHTRHKGEMEGEVPFHVVTGRKLDICVMVNWYPPTLSISLDSEEREGRV